MEYLDLCPEACKAYLNAKNTSPIDKITVGAAIIRTDTSTPQILLLKCAEDEEYYPDMFELPGGKIDQKKDETIRDAVIREVLEETLLLVLRVTKPLKTIRYTTEKTVTDATGHGFPLRRRTIQLSYIVEIKDNCTDFKFNPEEHSMGIWTDAKGLKDLPMTPEMRDLALEALEHF